MDKKLNLKEKQANLFKEIKRYTLTYNSLSLKGSSTDLAKVLLEPKVNDYRKEECSFVFSPTKLNSKISERMGISSFHNFEDYLLELEDEYNKICRIFDFNLSITYCDGTDRHVFEFGYYLFNSKTYFCSAEDKFKFRSDFFRARLYQTNEVIYNKHELLKMKLKNLIFDFNVVKTDYESTDMADEFVKYAHPNKYDENYYIKYLVDKYPDYYADYRKSQFIS